MLLAFVLSFNVVPPKLRLFTDKRDLRQINYLLVCISMWFNVNNTIQIVQLRHFECIYITIDFGKFGKMGSFYIADPFNLTNASPFIGISITLVSPAYPGT